MACPRSPYPEDVEWLPSPHPSTRLPSGFHSQLLASAPPPVSISASELGGAAAGPIFGLQSLQGRCTSGRVDDAEALWVGKYLEFLGSGAQLNKAAHVLCNW